MFCPFQMTYWEGSPTRRGGMVFQWRTPVKFGFQAPEMVLVDLLERGLIGLNTNEWSGTDLSEFEMGNLP